jgi:hypothetical protein
LRCNAAVTRVDCNFVLGSLESDFDIPDEEAALLVEFDLGNAATPDQLQGRGLGVAPVESRFFLEHGLLFTIEEMGVGSPSRTRARASRKRSFDACSTVSLASMVLATNWEEPAWGSQSSQQLRQVTAGRHQQGTGRKEGL